MKYTWRQWRWILLWGINLVIIFAVWSAVSLPLMSTGYTALMLGFSRLAALLAGYTLLVQLWLIGRGKWLEADFGLDKLTRIHRWNGFAAVLLVLVHVPTILLAYAPVYNVQIPQVLPILMGNFEDITKALIAEILLFIVAGSSLVIARRRLKYEWWYYVHLATYLVILLAVGHQLSNGKEILALPWFKAYWMGLYVTTAASVLYYRFFLPFWKWNKHKFRVARVVHETKGVSSIYLRGQNLQNFRYEAGQFAKYWFVAKGYWLEEHPFSFSVEPNGQELRITYKNVGDFTAKLDRIPIETPVVVDGPYGRFTSELASQPRLVFVAGGIGITPIRAMLGELAQSGDKRELWLFYTARSVDDLALKREIESLTKDVKLKLRYVITEGEVKGRGMTQELLTAKILQREVGTLEQTDFYICGPPSLMTALRSQLVDAGVARELIHYEQFSLVKR